MQARAIERGTILQGEYVLLEPVGEAADQVFRARRRRDGRMFIVRLWHGGAQGGMDPVLALAEQASRVTHPIFA
jgi:hypothetical protein